MAPGEGGEGVRAEDDDAYEDEDDADAYENPERRSGSLRRAGAGIGWAGVEERVSEERTGKNNEGEKG